MWIPTLLAFGIGILLGWAASQRGDRSKGQVAKLSEEELDARIPS